MVVSGGLPVPVDESVIVWVVDESVVVDSRVNVVEIVVEIVVLTSLIVDATKGINIIRTINMVQVVRRSTRPGIKCYDYKHIVDFIITIREDV